jgi:hypothetical protein
MLRRNLKAIGISICINVLFYCLFVLLYGKGDFWDRLIVYIFFCFGTFYLVFGLLLIQLIRLLVFKKMNDFIVILAGAHSLVLLIITGIVSQGKIFEINHEEFWSNFLFVYVPAIMILCFWLYVLFKKKSI